MNTTRQPSPATTAPLLERLTGSVAVAWFALGMVLAVLAGIVGFGTLHLRLHLREHLVSRDGEILTTVALARQYANGAGSNLTRRINIPADQLALALDISRLRDDTLGVRLFDADGRFVTAVPPTLEPATLGAAELQFLRRLQPASRFHEAARLKDFFMVVDDNLFFSTSMVGESPRSREATPEISQPRSGWNQAENFYVPEGRRDQFVFTDGSTVPAGTLSMVGQPGTSSLANFQGRFATRANIYPPQTSRNNSLPSGETMPLLEVNIPLHARGDTQLVAAAQLLLDGRPLLREYARIDQHLWWIALGLYAGGAALLTGVLVWAYRRLRRAHQQLADRTARLLRANHELSLAAKNSALGSVTAHLIHGLSNPLANLQHALAAQNGKAGADMETVAAATRRMQQLVDEVVRVLGEERVGEQYELTLRELADNLTHKLAASAETAGVTLEVTARSDATLNNRTANLTLLILENLVHNALKVSPAGRAVRVELVRAPNGDVFGSVADEGPGLPPEILPRLFTPCRSTHEGSGLGLASSKQLANQLGADLELAASASTGCVFTLRLPAQLFQGSPPAPQPSDSVATFTE